MAAPASTDEFLDLVRKSGVTDERRFAEYVTKSKAANSLAADASRMAGLLVRDGILTQFQAEQILQGKWRRFTIGKYKVLERIGAGGMGSVYLCEHKLMRRRVAVKVLPTAKATDPSALERFYREARAVAALDHPNIVHAYDIDQDEQLHFLVMEYVDGSNLQDIVKKGGPVDVLRACHYMRQAALGLEHANNAGLVHRDIKPGNILVDRTGCVKILDMGLARFFNDEEDMLTKKFDENVLGTADYLAPEQAIDSHSVDIRADIYSLGATFYFMLTGRTPFGEGTIAQKLLWHQTRAPKLVSEYRKDLPQELVDIVSKMMDKEPANRFQLPGELADALAPFTVTPIGPPPEIEMPSLSPAAQGGNQPAEQSSDRSNSPLSDSPGHKALQGMGSASKPQSGNRASPSVETSANVSAGSNTPVSPAPKSSRPNAPANPRPPETPSAKAKTSASNPAPNSPRPAPNLPTPRRTPPSATGPQEFPWLANDRSEATFEPEPAKKPAGPKSNAPKSSPGKTAPKAASTDKGRLAGMSRKTVYLVGGGAIALTALVVVLAIVFGSSRPVVAPPRKPLEVTSDFKNRPGTFPTIAAAMRKAKKGDVIQIEDELHKECLDINIPKMSLIPTEITIQGAPGKHVVWTTSKPAQPDEALLIVRHGANLRIQDITFDGKLDDADRVKNLVEMNFASPGLTFERVKFRAFEKAGLKIMNAAGEPDRPIRISDCEFAFALGVKPPEPQVAKVPDAAVTFHANLAVEPKINDHIDFTGVRFDADVKTQARAVRAANAPAEQVIVGEQVKGIQITK